MKWNSQEIVKDLKGISGVLNVEIHDAGGDVDTENLLIYVEGCEDILYACGFDVENDPADQSNCDCEFVEVQDGKDSRGGLNSDNISLGIAYVHVRKYFMDKGFNVVATMDGYF